MNDGTDRRDVPAYVGTGDGPEFNTRDSAIRQLRRSGQDKTRLFSVTVRDETTGAQGVWDFWRRVVPGDDSPLLGFAQELLDKLDRRQGGSPR